MAPRTTRTIWPDGSVPPLPLGTSMPSEPSSATTSAGAMTITHDDVGVDPTCSRRSGASWTKGPRRTSLNSSQERTGSSAASPCDGQAPKTIPNSGRSSTSISCAMATSSRSNPSTSASPQRKPPGSSDVGLGERAMLYDDGRVACDDRSLVVRVYYLWGGAKTIPYATIRHWRDDRSRGSPASGVSGDRATSSTGGTSTRSGPARGLHSSSISGSGSFR